jgi:RNA polymerase sigma-70 factor, ECF subfamily
MSSAFVREALIEESDSKLIVATRTGRADAFGRLVSRHEARMFRVAFNITHDRENAKDVVQQSFHKAFVNLGRFRQKAAFSTWLTRIVINESLMCLRRDRARKEVSFEEHFTEKDGAYSVEMEDGRKNPEESYESVERARILSGAIQELNRDFRNVLHLQLEDCSLAEAAEVLRISVGALKARLFRARRQLRGLVEQSMSSVR